MVFATYDERIYPLMSTIDTAGVALLHVTHEPAMLIVHRAAAFLTPSSHANGKAERDRDEQRRKGRKQVGMESSRL
jgi:hypothetical protein